MKITKIYVLNRDELRNKSYDLFITSSGYEERSSYIAQNIDPKADKRVVFGFVENKENPIRKKNDIFYRTKSYQYYEANISDDISIVNFLKEYLNSLDKTEVSILMDYSSMTRCWYGSIINFLRNFNNTYTKHISITFAYSRATFTAPPDNENQTYFFQPISGFSSLSIPNNPTALIIGLGYEKRRAFGLKEFFDAEETYVFYTDKDSAPDFYNVILERNKEILDQISPNYIFEYPITDLLYTKKLLSDICTSLNKDYRILITPCGPKPFTLISLITASEFPNIDVWRISGDKGYGNSDRIASGEILCLTIEYNND